MLNSLRKAPLGQDFGSALSARHSHERKGREKDELHGPLDGSS